MARGLMDQSLVRRGQKSVMAHRYAWERVNGPVPDGMHVCHRCDVPACVNPAHLFLGTNADNTADKHAKGRSARGEKDGNSKLTARDVVMIRKARASGESFTRIAARYGVWYQTIQDIIAGRTWRHVPS